MSDKYKNELLERIATFCDMVNEKIGESVRIEFILTRARIIYPEIVDGLDEATLEWMVEAITEIRNNFESGYNDYNFPNPADIIFDIPKKCILFKIGNDHNGKSLNIKWKPCHTPSLFFTNFD